MTIEASESVPALAPTARGVAVLVLVGVGLGALMGLVWAAITTDLVIDITENGPVPTLVTEDHWFDADGWFAVLGAVTGFLLAAFAWWRLRQRPVVMLCGVLASALMAALTAWWVGGLVGPDDPGSLADLDPGTVVTAALGLRATGVLLVPAVAALGAIVVAATLVKPREGAPRPQ